METMIHPETGETLRRGVRKETMTYRGREVTFDAPGWYPEGEGEGVHVGTDNRSSDRALHLLMALDQGLLVPDEIKAIRKKLKLTQAEAGEIIGGGPRAFQKYESGEIMLSKAIDSALRMLDYSPSGLDDLRRHRTDHMSVTKSTKRHTVHA